MYFIGLIKIKQSLIFFQCPCRKNSEVVTIRNNGNTEWFRRYDQAYFSKIWGVYTRIVFQLSYLETQDVRCSDLVFFKLLL